MTKLPLVAVLSVLAAVPTFAQNAEPIRRGFDTYNRRPYNLCNWIVVTGPGAARQNIIEQAKKAYAEPDPRRLASVESTVFIEILTVPDRTSRCANRTPQEIIFVDKKTDTPALRLPLKSREVALSNGFGATWQANDGMVIAPLNEFSSSLKNEYHVVVVFADGGTERIGQGLGRTVWSGKETAQVR